ncbi:MAG: sulfurtransferase TusA family protein [Desulfobacterium sp.]|nr:sulfurtransferase TusA family protein [Desulfobacterium sp.]
MNQQAEENKEKWVSPGHVLDLRGGISPFTLLKVSNTFRQMQTGEILEVLWSNPETSSQIRKVLPRDSWEEVKMEAVREKGAWFTIQLRKTAIKGGTND